MTRIDNGAKRRTRRKRSGEIGDEEGYEEHSAEAFRTPARSELASLELACSIFSAVILCLCSNYPTLRDKEIRRSYVETRSHVDFSFSVKI